MGKNGRAWTKTLGKRSRGMGVDQSRLMAQKDDLEAILAKGVENTEETK